MMSSKLSTSLFQHSKKVGVRSYSQLPMTEPLPTVKPQQPVAFTAPELQATVLENGIRVVTVANKQPTAAVGVFVNGGSRSENADNNGASFFLRRFGWKSTQNMSALKLVRSVELLGAKYDITSTRENSAFVTELPSENVRDILPILREALHPNVKEYEVLESQEFLSGDIAKVQSDAGALSLELAHQVAYRNSGLGQSSFTPSYNIENLSAETLADFVKSTYTTGNVVVVATGAVEHKEFVSLVNQHFKSVRSGKATPSNPSPYSGGEARYPSSGDTHVVLGFEGAANSHALNILKFALGTGSNVAPVAPIGSGVSGKLNRNVVENSKVVSEASAFNYSYSDAGFFGVHAVAKRGGNAASVVASLAKELRGVASLSEEEFARAKALYKASVAFGAESRSNVLSFVANQTLSKVSNQLPSDVVKAIDAVTAADVAAAAKKALSSNPTLVVYGDVTGAPSLDAVKAMLH